MAMNKKKKKKLLALVLLLILAVILFVLVGVLSKRNSSDDGESTGAETVKLFDFKNTDVYKVSYTLEGEEISFERSKTDEDWRLSGKDTAVDQTKVNDIVSTACAINRDRELGSGLLKKDFGLESPKASIRLTLEGDKTYELFIGDNTGNSDSSSYAYLSGEDKIFTMSNNILSKLDKDVTAFLKMAAYPAVTSDQLTKLTIKQGDYVLELLNDPEDLTEAEAIGSTTWYYSEDGVYLPVNQSNCEELLKQVTSVTFASCVTNDASEADLAKYGLSSPKAEITVNYTVTDSKTEETDTTDANGSKYKTSTTTSKEVFTLLIGDRCTDTSSNDSDEQYYYAAIKGSSEVCRVSSALAEYFTATDFSDYVISLYPALCNFNGISEIDADYQGRTLKLSVKQTTTTEGGEESTAYDCSLNGETCDEKTARSVFASFIRITADHIIKDEDIRADGKVLFSYKYYTTYEKKPEISIEIREYDDVYYQLSLNGKAKYAVTKQEFNTLISNLGDNLK